MDLPQHGAERVCAFVRADLLGDLTAFLTAIDGQGPGTRITGSPDLDFWLDRSGLNKLVTARLGALARPVRAIFFDKHQAMNWSLGWHQDRTIAVRRRERISGFETWSVKAGIPHVEPPFELIERMITVRIHIDPVDATNAPLLIVEGSHRDGKIAEAQIDERVEWGQVSACHADAGDVWLYSTPILHASGPCTGDRSRRVLQIDYSFEQLPSPVEWRGIA